MDYPPTPNPPTPSDQREREEAAERAAASLPRRADDGSFLPMSPEPPTADGSGGMQLALAEEEEDGTPWELLSARDRRRQMKKVPPEGLLFTRTHPQLQPQPPPPGPPAHFSVAPQLSAREHWLRVGEGALCLQQGRMGRRPVRCISFLHA